MSLVQDLTAACANEKRAQRPLRKECPVLGDPETKLTRWKLQDWAYYEPNLPTYARGLFTLNEKIVIRGYNKFFNQNEVPSTRWDFLEKNCIGPFECTRKENGCIIFFSGLNGKLVVTSKQATESPHAEMGLEWIRKHLASVKKTPEELAAYLEKNNLTAAAELCDDAFEEHVITYAPNESGLYLTGLNRNFRHFDTIDFKTVQEFARTWGFLETQSHTCLTFTELTQFLQEGAKTGSWKGNDIEGFVVRCKIPRALMPPAEALADSDLADYFFKYKFEEPYMMHRCWREMTIKYLNDPLKPHKTKPHHRESTERFKKFMIPYIRDHPELRESILEGKRGFHEIQHKFYESTSLTDQDLLSLGITEKEKNIKFVLVPVATLGCGKTTVARALANLTKWAHVQNDDITKKSKRDTLVRNAIDALETTEAVIFDRNNHMLRERQQLFDDLISYGSAQGYDLVFVGLDFWPNGSYTSGPKREITQQQVLDRGNNHQTINNMSKPQILGIMKGFYGRYEPLNTAKAPDDQFDSVVPLEIKENGSRDNVARVLEHMRATYGFDNFTPAQIDKAVSEALKVEVKPITAPKAKIEAPLYYGLRLDAKEVRKLVPNNVAPANLKIQTHFHVTLAHRKSHKAIHTKLTKMHSKKLEKPTKETVVGEPEKIRILEYCWNDKVAAFLVEPTTPSGNLYPHITVACAPQVSPVEANTMLAGEPNRMKIDKEISGELTGYYPNLN